jgi:hypothetical protein
VGAGHGREGIGCQDRSAATVSDGTDGWGQTASGEWAYVIVSDGHGSASSFRSDIGARFAVEALEQAFRELKEWLLDPPEPGAVHPLAATPTPSTPPPASAATWGDRLYRSHWKRWAPLTVVNTWRTRVHEHLLWEPPDLRHPEPGLNRFFTQMERREGWESLYRLLGQVEAFRCYAQERSRDEAPGPLPPIAGDWDGERFGSWQAVAYGATLLGVLIGPEALYWFRIGDGAMMQIVGGQPSVLVQPPAEAIANETPSLCGDKAVNSIDAGSRALASGHIPSAIVLTSDGVPNSYTEPEGFLDFCRDIARAAGKPRDELARKLPTWLQEISRAGSGDDMSVAMAWATEDQRDRRIRAARREVSD